MNAGELQTRRCHFCAGEGWRWSTAVGGIEDLELCLECNGHGEVLAKPLVERCGHAINVTRLSRVFCQMPRGHNGAHRSATRVVSAGN